LHYCFFFFYSSGPHRDLHSFPTRRSSDLQKRHQIDRQVAFWRDHRHGVLLRIGESFGGQSRHPVLRTRVSARQTERDIREKEKRSEEHTSELQSQSNLVCRLLLEKKKKKK